jgi:hypothetical protein
MPLIERQDKTERVELKVKIRPEVLGDLEQYAAFLDSEIWYVAQELLRDAMSRDKEFQTYLKRKDTAPKTAPAELLKKGAA